jgi:hypothetical protein
MGPHHQVVHFPDLCADRNARDKEVKLPKRNTLPAAAVMLPIDSPINIEEILREHREKCLGKEKVMGERVGVRSRS